MQHKTTAMRTRILFLAILSCIVVNGIKSQNISPYKNWGNFANRAINAAASDANYTYIGGAFTKIGYAPSYLAKTTTTNAYPDAKFPSLNGEVGAIISDGNGGWYIAGNFTKVDTFSRSGYARINADGSVHNWKPPVSNTYAYYSCLLLSGSSVFLGGNFNYYNGVDYINYLAKVDAVTGNVDASWKPNPNYYVKTMVLSGGSIYTGGDFTSIGGQSINCLAKLDPGTGAADATFKPNPNSTVNCILPFNNSLYVAGNFNSIGGQARYLIAKLKINGTVDGTWIPNANASVFSLMNIGSSIYVAGGFNTIGGKSRNLVAKLDSTNGMADAAWDANFITSGNNYIYSMAFDGTNLILGGNFKITIGGTLKRDYLVQINAATTIPTPWNPKPGYSGINTICLNGTNVLMGGSFYEIGFDASGLARIINSTGQIDTTWLPPSTDITNYNGIQAIAINGSSLYVGGRFTNIYGVTRNSIAKLNTNNGTVITNWNPSPDLNSTITAITLSGTAVYVGGEFTSIGGQARLKLAKLDSTNGTVTNWLADVNSSTNINKILADDNTNSIYVAGNFSSIGGVSKNSIAKLDNSTGAVDPIFNPNLSLYTEVRCMAIAGNDIYVGGSFSTIGGQTNYNLAKLDKTSGNANGAWKPNPSGYISDICVDGNNVYIAGGFSTIGGQSRTNFAKISSATGAAIADWYPYGTDYQPTAILKDNSNIFVYGGFSQIGNLSLKYAAKFPKSSPSQYSITGGGNYLCSSGGVTIGLSGSDVGTSYQLQRNGVNTGSPVSGTGSIISFGNQTGLGTYTAVANSPSLLIPVSNLSGNVNVSITYTQNTTLKITPSITMPFCSGTSVTFNTTASNLGTSPVYQWYKNGVAIAGATASTYSDNALNNNDSIRCTVSSTGTCIAPGIISSNAIIASVKAKPSNTSVSANSVIVFTGGSLVLNCTSTDATAFNWIGPNSFTSTQQNPVVSNMIASKAGTYTVTPSNSCGNGTSSSVVITIDPATIKKQTLQIEKVNCVTSNTALVTVRAKNFINTLGFQGTIKWDKTVLAYNAAILPGSGTINLDTTTNINTSQAAKDGLITFFWNDVSGLGASIADSTVLFSIRFNALQSASNSVISFDNNPSPLEIDAISVYSGLPISTPDTSFINGYVNTNINFLSVKPISNSPVVVGDTIKLSSRLAASTSYTWTGPNGFYATTNNYNIANSTTANAGFYKVIADSAGCKSIADSVEVKILSSFTLNGVVRYPGTSTGATGNPVKGVTISLNNGSNTTTQITPTNGTFSFTGQQPRLNYIVTPSKSNDVIKANGVSVADLILIQSHILNKTLLNSPYKIIAADVDNNGKLSVLDIVLIRRFILGLDTYFPGTRLWAFVDSNYNFPDVTKPFPYPNADTLNNLYSDKTKLNFIGVRLGDVTWDWDNTKSRSSMNIAKPVELYYDDVVTTKNNSVKLAIKAKDFTALKAMQFTLRFNPKLLKWKGIVNKNIKAEINATKANDGIINVLWANENDEAVSLKESDVLFELNFDVLDKLCNEDIAIDGSDINVESWDNNYRYHVIVKGRGVINSKEELLQDINFDYSLSPNPSKGLVNIITTSAIKKIAKVELVAEGGKIIFNQNITVFPGKQSQIINVKESRNLTNGTYFIKINGLTKPLVVAD